jgi:DNA invertase Pin-like site-specific DNA recombinase
MAVAGGLVLQELCEQLRNLLRLLLLHPMSVAQHEREIISARTSAALRAAKARGKQLGNPRLSEARQNAAVANKQKADHYSANILPVIREIQRSGVQSLRGVARALTARGVRTARGGAWTPVQVSAILRRAG